MKVLELFAGTRSIGKAFEARGHEVFSVEWNKRFENINLYADINTLTAKDILERFGHPDVIWASPDCTSFSIAAISHHRRKNPETGNLDPVSDYAKFCDAVDQHVLELIRELNPMFYFIENPRGGMRKMAWMKDLPRYSVTYCQYGDTRMKPTDIWTNHPAPDFKPMCKNGDPCHVRAPRGAKTGTQGLKGSIERGIIPQQLCEHIVTICEKYHKEGASLIHESSPVHCTVANFVKEVHENAQNHGWWDGAERTFPELIALCHGELSEALEEYRNGHAPTETYYTENGKPEGIPSELADVILRVFDMCGHYGIDIVAAIKEKHEYNKNRPYKHGNKKI